MRIWLTLMSLLIFPLHERISKASELGDELTKFCYESMVEGAKTTH